MVQVAKTKKTKNTDSTAIKESKHDNMFKLVKNKQGKVVIVVGNQIISQKSFTTFASADAYIGTKPWELIVNLNYLILKQYEKEINKNAEKQSKENA